MNRPKVLVAEDENIVAKDLQLLLGRLGYVCQEVVGRGDAAVQKAHELRPNLVVMDIMLKGEVDGIAAAEAIRSNTGIPVVFLTAYGDEETLRRAKAAGPYGYVLKPFEERQLDIVLQMALLRHDLEETAKHNADLSAVALLANAMAHEINNPLAVMRATLEMMKTAFPAGTRQATWLKSALGAADLMEEIASRLGKVKRLECIEKTDGLPVMLDIWRSSEAS
jgi:CheY-like chemotaxis protein